MHSHSITDLFSNGLHCATFKLCYIFPHEAGGCPSLRACFRRRGGLLGRGGVHVGHNVSAVVQHPVPPPEAAPDAAPPPIRKVCLSAGGCIHRRQNYAQAAAHSPTIVSPTQGLLAASCVCARRQRCWAQRAAAWWRYCPRVAPTRRRPRRWRRLQRCWPPRCAMWRGSTPSPSGAVLGMSALTIWTTVALVQTSRAHASATRAHLSISALRWPPARAHELRAPLSIPGSASPSQRDEVIRPCTHLAGARAQGRRPFV